MILHAGCLARMAGGCWRGVLLTGPSGIGKSDLALRLIGRGWTMVADDRVLVWPSEGRLYARAPDTLSGLIEARGLDVLTTRFRSFARIELLADCLPPAAGLDRIPAAELRTVAGVPLPRVAVKPLEPSAPVKLDLALARAARPF